MALVGIGDPREAGQAVSRGEAIAECMAGSEEARQGDTQVIRLGDFKNGQHPPGADVGSRVPRDQARTPFGVSATA